MTPIETEKLREEFYEAFGRFDFHTSEQSAEDCGDSQQVKKDVADFFLQKMADRDKSLGEAISAMKETLSEDSFYNRKHTGGSHVDTWNFALDAVLLLITRDNKKDR